MNKSIQLVDKLFEFHSLTVEEYQYLLDNRNSEIANYLRENADSVRREYYGNKIFIRGLIEISNVCKNNCLYCGIRGGNDKCERYRLSEEEILFCCENGYGLGFRTFVLQGGEDGFYTDDFLCTLLKKIKERYPDCAVTLSLGERSKESYERLFSAGADRYLLRHEAASKELYKRLHPEIMSYSNRMKCLYDLKEIGYQVGCGFMVGAPFQTTRHLAEDLKFIEKFKPDMCGIGPFIPHKDTIFKNEKTGSVELTCFLLSIIRLIHPPVLLPATTALGTISENGREEGILSGANVVMPNLSPTDAREKYSLYDNKLSTGLENAVNKKALEEKFMKIGFEIVTDKGDVKKYI